MDKIRAWGIGISLFLFVVSAYLLFTASPLLTLGLDEADTIPLGTFITWIGIIAFPSFLFFSIGDLYAPKSSLARWFSKLLKALIVLAVLWIPLSALLAGNLSFSFTSEKSNFQGGLLASQFFWYFTYFLVLTPVIVTVIYKLISFFSSFRKESS